ncbi:hypothetical protein Bbelb_048080 [Branchiostoma belcheri]|nr:hypothetical protein Bbelb_048080 [Branchiostoma belcheri]
MCVTARLPLPERTKEHSSRDSDEHNMHDEISHRSPCVLPLDCSYPSVPKNTQAGTCTKEHSSRDSDEHNMHDEKITPLVMYVTARLPYPSVPKNTQAGTVTNTTCTTKRSHRSPCVLPLDCPYPSVPKEHPSRDSDEHNMHDVKVEVLVVLP